MTAIAVIVALIRETDFGDLRKPMDDDEFADFCQRHRDLRIEMDKSE